MTTKRLIVSALLLPASLILCFAIAAHADPPLPNIPAATFNVTDFGAVGDGVTDNTFPIQNAIDTAAGAGGGTVVVAAVGMSTNYLCGPVILANNVGLQISSGTKLQMLPITSWPDATLPFISGSKLHDVAITGTGTIDGNAGFSIGAATDWWGDPPPAKNPVATRPIMINLSSCTNLLIEGISLQNPPTFHIVLKGGGVGVTVQRILINTSADSHNTDGIQLAATNVVIRNCTINTGDDNMAIGSGGGVSADILITNCTFGVGHGLTIGTSVAKGVHGLIVSNCYWNGTEYGIHMKSQRGQGGVMENLVYQDLVMSNVNFVIAIYSTYDWIGAPKDTINITPSMVSTAAAQTVTNTTPIWRNIMISNVTAVLSNGNIAGIIWGLPEMAVSNITLSHVNILSPQTNTFCVYNTKGLQIIDSNLTAPTTSTNTLTLYNAEVIVTNSAPNANLVTVGGLAVPPTNNTLTFFNAQVAITDTNELGADPITLGGSTLTLSQSSVDFSNNVTAVSASTLSLTGGSNTYRGLTGGRLALNLPTGTLLLYGGVTLPSGSGTSTVANLTIGDCGQSIAGFLTVAGGSLYVTNGSQTGVLDVRDGTLTQISGLLNVDTLVVTSACANVVHNGGTLLYHSLILDPNQSAVGDGIPNGWKQQYGLDPFDPSLVGKDPDGDGMSNLQEYLAGSNPVADIKAITQQGNDIRVTWRAAVSKTNALQRSTGLSGSYSNNFVDIFVVNNNTGGVTNYLDVGAATNRPALYYRVRLVP